MDELRHRKRFISVDTVGAIRYVLFNLNYGRKMLYVVNGATTLSITTFSIMTLIIKCIFETLSITDIQHNNTQHNRTSAIMLNVIMLGVVIYLLLC